MGEKSSHGGGLRWVWPLTLSYLMSRFEVCGDGSRQLARLVQESAERRPTQHRANNAEATHEEGLHCSAVIETRLPYVFRWLCVCILGMGSKKNSQTQQQQQVTTSGGVETVKFLGLFDYCFKLGRGNGLNAINHSVVVWLMQSYIYNRSISNNNTVQCNTFPQKLSLITLL